MTSISFPKWVKIKEKKRKGAFAVLPSGEPRFGQGRGTLCGSGKHTAWPCPALPTTQVMTRVSSLDHRYSGRCVLSQKSIKIMTNSKNNDNKNNNDNVSS